MYSIVLFDDESREVGRIFPGKLLCIDLAFSPDGTRLAAVMCSGKKTLPAKSKKAVRSGECLMIWDIDDLAKKPEKTPLERAAALPLSPRMAKILGREPKRSIQWKDDDHVEAVPKDGKGKLVWAV